MEPALHSPHDRVIDEHDPNFSKMATLKVDKVGYDGNLNEPIKEKLFVTDRQL